MKLKLSLHLCANCKQEQFNFKYLQEAKNKTICNILAAQTVQSIEKN